MGLYHDPPLLLGFCSKIQPAFHGLASEKHSILRRVPKFHLLSYSNQCMFPVPLQVQLHQLVNVKAEADVGDGAAGVGLTGGWRIRSQ